MTHEVHAVQQRGQRFAIADVATDEAVGNFPVAVKDDVAVLAYWLGPAHRGRGLATEALMLTAEWVIDEGLASAAELEIHPHNVPSRRVAERAGFIEVGKRSSDRSSKRCLACTSIVPM